MSESRKRLRFKLGEIILEYRQALNHQVLLCNASQLNPHLTITWGNPGKTINVHITNNLPNGEKDYQHIVRVPENEFAQAIELPEQSLLNFFERLVQSVKWVRPGWLGKKGFQLQCQSEEWRKRIFELVVPKEKLGKGKNKKLTYLLEKMDVERGLEEIDLYPPVYLHELSKIGYADIIFAYSRSRKEPFVLSYVPGFNGQCRWAMIDPLKVQRLFEDDFKNLILPRLEKLFPQESWKVICQRLQLGGNRIA